MAAILEGAAQVLEAGGLAAFTTNAVAERAGVSIGTLYQYFADKNALIQALAQRELQAALVRVRAALLGEIDPSPEGRVRAMVRAIVTAFRGRQRARKAVLQAILSQRAGSELLAPVAVFLAEAEAKLGQEPRRAFAALDHRQLFVVSRALMGAIRAAVLEEKPFLRAPEFEDELVRLVMSYLR
ncbi:MAG TPA: TetR family transcriptional regulator, partial [Ktedonobacterales bacterium]|nr:TetR family transcriptional regulator [Ktedonobacterales bacterium]